MTTNATICDLVMEGGGVKGLGLVGALAVLGEEGYQVRRVAGTSAGAIVGSLVAAGLSPQQLHETMTTLDYRKFRDEGAIDRLGLAGKAASLLWEKGIYEGNFLRSWLSEQLATVGVRTFRDLRLDDDWAQQLPPERRYRLMVIATDVTRGRLVRLPWDYAKYGLDPDEQSVAEAVRASMSLPFFYEPAHVGKSLLVDGAVLSNFPIDSFDDMNDSPTFGIKLSAKPGTQPPMMPTRGPVEFTKALVATAMNAHDQIHLDDPCTVRRTMFIDTSGVNVTQFDITAKEQERLYERGRHGASKFLQTWDYAAYQRECGNLR